MRQRALELLGGRLGAIVDERHHSPRGRQPDVALGVGCGQLRDDLLLGGENRPGELERTLLVAARLERHALQLHDDGAGRRLAFRDAIQGGGAIVFVTRRGVLRAVVERPRDGVMQTRCDERLIVELSIDRRRGLLDGVGDRLRGGAALKRVAAADQVVAEELADGAGNLRLAACLVAFTRGTLIQGEADRESDAKRHDSRSHFDQDVLPRGKRPLRLLRVLIAGRADHHTIQPWPRQRLLQRQRPVREPPLPRKRLRRFRTPADDRVEADAAQLLQRPRVRSSDASISDEREGKHSIGHSCWVFKLVRRGTKRSAALPEPCDSMIAISHTLAMLRKRSFPGSSISSRASVLSRGLSSMNHKKLWVSSNSLIPCTL